VTALDRDAARLGAELERERAGAAEKVELLARAEARLKDAFSSLRRPDLIVRLPSGRSVAVDSKVPLSHYLEALEAADEDARVAALRRHAA
jgi:DNA anti-recombination protein RmuC